MVLSRIRLLVPLWGRDAGNSPSQPVGDPPQLRTPQVLNISCCWHSFSNNLLYPLFALLIDLGSSLWQRTKKNVIFMDLGPAPTQFAYPWCVRKRALVGHLP